MVDLVKIQNLEQKDKNQPLRDVQSDNLPNTVATHKVVGPKDSFQLLCSNNRRPLQILRMEHMGREHRSDKPHRAIEEHKPEVPSASVRNNITRFLSQKLRLPMQETDFEMLKTLIHIKFLYRKYLKFLIQQFK